MSLYRFADLLFGFAMAGPLASLPARWRCHPGALPARSTAP
jgi:hypothetical protein